MSIEKLKKQKAAIEAQIEQAAQVEKHRGKVEKILLKLLKKHPGVCLADIKQTEEIIGQAMAGIAASASKQE